MRKQSTKNVLMKDGSVRRLPADRCEQLLGTNEARRYVSNTVWRATKLGIEVKNHGTRDEDGSLRKQIQAARAKQEKKRKAKEKKQKEQEADSSDE